MPSFSKILQAMGLAPPNESLSISPKAWELNPAGQVARANIWRKLLRLGKSCWGRKFILRALYFVVGFALGFVASYLIKRPGGEQHSWRSLAIDAVIGVVVGLIVWALAELVVTYLEFRFPHKHDFKLRKLISEFIENHAHLDDKEKAKVALSLFLAHEREDDTIEMNMTFGNYLKLLSAATGYTEGNWFATYRLSLTEWNNISDNSASYFRKLKRCRIKKERIVLGPSSEIDQISYDSDIVKDTIDVGAQLLALTLGENERIEDYALFDDRLVITATPADIDDGAASNATYAKTDLNTEMKVQLLKGNFADKYSSIRRRFLRDPRVKRYTSQGRKEHVKKLRSQTEKGEVA